MHVYCFLLLCTTAQAQVDLSLNLEAGKTYPLAVDIRIAVTQTVDGKEVANVQWQHAGYRFTVLSVLDSGYLLEARFTDLHQRIESPEDTSDHTSGDTLDLMCTLLNRLVDKPFRVMMGKDHAFKQVDGFAEVMRGMYAGYPLSASAKADLDSMITDQVRTMLLETPLLRIPLNADRRVMPMEVWAVYSTKDQRLATSDSANYYLAEIYSDDLVVKGDGHNSSLPKEQVQDGISTIYELTGTMRYTARFDKKTRWIKRSETVIEQRGQAVNRQLGTLLRQTVPMKIVTKTVIESRL